MGQSAGALDRIFNFELRSQTQDRGNILERERGDGDQRPGARMRRRVWKRGAGWLRNGGFDGVHDGMRKILIGAFDQDHLFVVIDLPQLDLDDLASGGLHMAANKAGLDRQFSMPAVDQHQQLYAAGPAVVKERI
jgi:hypothetical protein